VVTAFFYSHCSIYDILCSVDADLEPSLVEVFEFHRSADHRKKSIVLASSHVIAGMEFRASLPDYDRSRINRFSSEPFDAQVTRIGITTVATGTYTFFMSHL